MCGVLGSVTWKKDAKVLEITQRRAPKLVTGMYGERLRMLEVSTLEKRMPRGDFIAFCSSLKRGSTGEGCQALLLETDGGT